LKLGPTSRGSSTSPTAPSSASEASIRTAHEEENDDGYVDAPVTAPLNDAEIARRLPTLSIRVGDPRPHVRGKIREYVVL
jgi:hypothetical protein